MRNLAALLLLSVTMLACGRGTHEVRIAGDNVEIRIDRRDDSYWASFARDGVRYTTTDPAVAAEVEAAVERHRRAKASDGELYRSVEDVFARAARQGKATRG